MILFCLPLLTAGSCWSNPKRGSGCGNLLRRGVTFKQCCQSQEMTYTKHQLVYSDRDARGSTQIFFLVYINPPRVCKPCPNPCSGMKCGINSRASCTLTKTRKARCVCNPDCAGTFRGKVCSTDQRTYPNECALLTESCHTKKNLEIDYYSECKESCNGVTCLGSKICVEDQYRVPHCITNAICKIRCVVKPHDEMLCGTDGVTYRNLCLLRQVVCHRKNGKSIGIAYKGHCRSNANCHNISCLGQNRCLKDGSNVRCVKCSSFCLGGFHIRKQVCGSDGKRYKNWCSLRKAACNLGRHIEVARNGRC
eukprot:Seg4070.2 transcript_id=Seg4070.2/GoldUCD/mRNA.D3Y31 product=Follistatin-A protein_id=Seg4070.2/GoldUCD/D3Y31